MHDIEKMAISIRRMLEPGFPVQDGKPVSAGTCLYASFLLQRALEQFADCSATVQGGDGEGDGGILGSDGNWHGHYWVEGRTFTGKAFVADITADQFGYDPVVVTPLKQARERYQPGSPESVQGAVEDIAEEIETHKQPIPVHRAGA